MYHNLMNLVYTLSDENGTVYYKALLKDLDLCTLLTLADYNPSLIQLQDNNLYLSRDRKILHNKLYYNLELLKRAGEDFIDVGYPIVYPNIFGNGRQRSCQIGTQNIKNINNSLFLTVYTDFPEDEDNGITNYLVPLIIDQSRKYSAPILVN